MNLVDEAFSKISRINHPNVILLRKKEYLRYLYGDYSFLFEEGKTYSKKDKQRIENEYGMNLRKEIRPDLDESKKHWTTIVGEQTGRELLLLYNHNILNTEVLVDTYSNNTFKYKLDFETDSVYVEIKTQTYFTEGTAGEKILGSSIKYADIPLITNKPLHIICIANGEFLCKNKYGILGTINPLSNKYKLLTLMKSMNIEYNGLTDLLNNL